MAPQFSSKIFILLFLCAITASHSSNEDRKVYIVYMGNADATPQSASHFNKLQKVVDSRFLAKSLVRSYSRSFNGFAANLTAQEREQLAGHEDVIWMFPSRTMWPQTTRSWDFMGMDLGVKRNPTIESDIIIGVIDSGVWPESESFSDTGFGPVPKKWKGVCNGGTNFTCNKKLIGARYYPAGSYFGSARDTMGHGTHTASTAAGNYVKDANFYGIARGTARGGVPSARIAAYKVCNDIGCSDADILAAFDDAIADGVDIITISLAGLAPKEISDDAISIGSLHAMQRGILTVHSAGNKGSAAGTVVSVVPWLLTVGASTTDRGIITQTILGNGKIIDGKSVNSFTMKGTGFPIVQGTEVSRKCDNEKAADGFCNRGYCLNSSLVTGKIVLCGNYISSVKEALDAGAFGVIVTSSERQNDVSFVVPMPATAIVTNDMMSLENYIHSTKDAKAVILTSESKKNVDAPKVATFSSKGPNPIIRDILKPDITSPGVEILAAYSPAAAPSRIGSDKRSVKFNLLSGTSMAAPHAAGAAAYVKSVHPDWSPSAIKSALMTTAWRMYPEERNEAEFSYGAGHTNPVDATDPGLVYETNPVDYVKMLCTIGYSSDTIQNLFGSSTTVNCSGFTDFEVKDLNYPSMTKEVVKGAPSSAIFLRTVTNVGFANSMYKAKTSESPTYDITVRPDTLTFGALNEKKSFEVIIRVKFGASHMVSASLEWSDGVHKVRSPIVLYTNQVARAAASNINYALVCANIFIILVCVL